MGDNGDFVMLTRRDQLELLALVLRNREESLMNKAFKTEDDRVKYLGSVNEWYEQATSLLKDSSGLSDKYSSANHEHKTIAADIFDYTRYGINMSLQCIRNCSLRATCVARIREHYDSLATRLQDETVKLDKSLVQSLAEEAVTYKETMWQYTNNYRSAGSRAQSELYSKVIKQEGRTVADVVNRHKNMLGFEGEFESLAEKEQLEVYNSIITESKRASIPKLEKLSAGVGVAVLVFTAGLMVWDIVAADDHAEAALRNSLTALEMAGAFAVQLTVDMAVSGLLRTLAIGLTELVVSVSAFVLSVGAGLLFCAAVGPVIDKIIGTGGSTAPELAADLRFHALTMPDGMAIANSIAHEDDDH